MFSQTVEYALRAVVCLAQSDGKALTAQQIASSARVPLSYNSKVLQLLGRAKLIRSTRGIGGGYELAVSAETLSVLDVINAIDPLKRITTCPLGLASHGTHLCPLHARLDGVIADAEEAFRTTVIAELLGGAARKTGLCEGQLVQIGG